MKKLLFALLLLASSSFAVDTLTVPTDFNTVTAGTRANLSTNFTSIQTWGNKVRDTVAQVTSRVTGYTGSLLVSSLSNLRLKVDADATETARLLVESGAGDSLFTVSEDSTAKFFGPLTVAGTSTFTGAPTFSSLTASLPVFTNGSKVLVSNAMTGTGSVVMSASPTFTGTLAAANGTYSGTLGVTGNTDIGGAGLGSGYRLSVNMASGVANCSFGAETNVATQINIRRNAATIGGIYTGGSLFSLFGGSTGANHVNIFSGGNVGIGSTTDGGELLQVTGTARVTGAVTMASTLGVAGTTSYTGSAGAAFSSGANGYYYSQITGNNQIALNSAGVFGFVSNPSINLWALGYGATATTLGTSALTWNNSGAVAIPGTLGVTGQTNITGAVGIGAGAGTPADKLTVQDAVVGDINIRVRNTDAGATSRAGINLITPAAAGDPFLGWAISGTTSWTAGIDNSVSGDPWVLSASSALGTSNVLSITTAGDVSIPGTATTTGVHTFTAAPVFSSATASQILSVDASKNLTSTATTGSGSVVLATGATLVTPALGAATATTIALGGNEAFDYDEGSFIVTLTGCTTSPTGTAYYTRVGKHVVIYIPALTATSNTSTLSVTGVPVSIRPARNQFGLSCQTTDNGIDYYSDCAVGTGGSLDAYLGVVSGTHMISGAFATSGTKGFAASTMAYTLQ